MRRDESTLRKLWRRVFPPRAVVVGPEDVMTTPDSRIPGRSRDPLDALVEESRRELAEILTDDRHGQSFIRRQLGHWRDKWHTELDTQVIEAMTARYKASAEALRALNDMRRAGAETVQLQKTLEREDAAARRADELADLEHGVRVQELRRKQDLDAKFRERDGAVVDAEIASIRAAKESKPSDDVNTRALQALDMYRAMRNRMLKLGLRNDAVTERVEAELALDKEFFAKLGVDPEVVRYLEEKTRRMLENLEEEQ